MGLEKVHATPDFSVRQICIRRRCPSALFYTAGFCSETVALSLSRATVVGVVAFWKWLLLLAVTTGNGYDSECS